MLTTDSRPLDLAALRAAVTGPVAGPADEGYDTARSTFNLAVDQRPAVVVEATSTADIVEAVRFARERGLRIAPQATGHNPGPMGGLEGSILLRTGRMRGVRVDVERQVARLEAGAQWQDVAPAAGVHGLAGLAGSAPDVSVVGYSLGGGIGWLARQYGLSANSIVAVELVTADARLIRVDADNEPELFWALRGGGGNFGVVTALEIRLYPVAEVYAGMLAWPIERASEVVKAWVRWTATAPREVTTALRLLQIPPFEEIPEFLRGRALVIVDGAVLRDESRGAATIAALRELGPEIDTFGMMPAAGLHHIHMDPEQPAPALSDHALLGELDDATLDRWIDAAAIGAGPLVMSELRQLGGALGQAADGCGALASIDARFAYFTIGIPITPEIGAAAEAHFPRVREALRVAETGRLYSNFQERTAGLGKMFDAATMERLEAVKDRFDPRNVFQANHEIRC